MDRRKIFEKHLQGLVLGESTLDAVKKKLGAPGRTLTEEKVTVLEYDAPKESSIAKWKKAQFIFFDGLLLNVSYVEPEPKLARKALHAVLGEPEDSAADDEGDEDEEEGLAEIFEVAPDEEPMLSFAVHYSDDESVEALSLCAELPDDLLGDDDEDSD